MSQEFQIQWYPGHMAKAKRLLVSQVGQVDFVIEVADARAPVTTRNPDIDELIAERPRLLLLSREDLAEPEALSVWVDRLKGQGLQVVTASLADPTGVNQAKARIRGWIGRIKRGSGPIAEGFEGIRGLRLPKSSIRSAVRRGIVVGIPNTGKSTLIRSMGGRSVMVGAKPGVTRNLQWVNVSSDVQLLDTPGLLWPRLESGSSALKLAWLGSVGEGAYDHLEAAAGLVRWFLDNRPQALYDRYGLRQEEDERSATRLLEGIALQRGLLARGGGPDLEQAAEALLWDLRKGRLGKVVFDDPAGA